jgi:hypothetical protein
MSGKIKKNKVSVEFLLAHGYNLTTETSRVKKIEVNALSLKHYLENNL